MSENHQEPTQETIEKKSGKKRITSKQVVAIIGIVFLLFIYVALLLSAIFDNSASGHIFWMCLFSSIAVPILIWIYCWLYTKVKEQKDSAKE